MNYRQEQKLWNLKQGILKEQYVHVKMHGTLLMVQVTESLSVAWKFVGSISEAGDFCGVE